MTVTIGSSTESTSQLQFIESEKVTNTHQEEKKDAKDIASLVGNNGVMALMFDKQSLRTDETRAVVAAQKRDGVQPDTQAAAKSVDLSTADDARPAFINVVGSMSQIEASNLIITVMTEAESTANKAAAAASIRSVDAANRAGGKMIEAAQQNMIGSITSGTMSMVGQGVTTARSMKALNKESSSITHTLRPARELKLGVNQHQSAIKSSKDNMVHQGKVTPPEVEANMSKSHARDMHTSALKRDAHSKVQNDTSKVRLTSDYTNQAIHSGKGIIDGTFGVSAAGKQKEAELARADREVNNELASVQSQTAKKSAEAKAALLNTLDNALNTNSSTIASMADRL